MLPTLAEFAARDDWKYSDLAVERALRVLIALTIPVAAVMAAGINPLVRAVFGFDAATIHADHLDDTRLPAHLDRLSPFRRSRPFILCAQRAHVSALRRPHPACDLPRSLASPA